MQTLRHLVERLTLSDCTAPAIVLALATGTLLAWSLLSLHSSLH
jgi:hypothetical protein